MYSFAAPAFCLLPFRSPHLRQLARLEFLVRHLWTVAPYITARKIYNLMLNVAELRLNVASPRSLPPYLKVEPTPLCQMACPGCAHGDRDLKKQLSVPLQQLRLVDFAKIVAPLYRTAFGVSLSLRGEPLLGQDLLPIIEYAHAKNLAVSFPTNLSIKLTRQKAARLVESGVDALHAASDNTISVSETRAQKTCATFGAANLIRDCGAASARCSDQTCIPSARAAWKLPVHEMICASVHATLLLRQRCH